MAIAAPAQTDSNTETFGTVGIAGGQAARLSVLNLGPRSQTGQCLVTMVFIDDQGALLKTNTFAVLPGRTASLDLVADTDLGLGTNDRRQIGAIFARLPQAPPACVLAPTLEIFDRSTGRTSILVVNPKSIPATPTPAQP